MHYYFAPWRWDTVDQPDWPNWRSPFASGVGCVDLRSSKQQRNDGVAEGFGLFATREQEAVPDSIYLGDSLSRLIDKHTLKTEFALGENIVASDVQGFAWELMTMLADPLGVDRVKPLGAGARGMTALYCGGLVARKRVRPTDPEWQTSLVRIQEDYRKIRQRVTDGKYDVEAHQRALAVWQAKYGIEDYTVFIPAGLPDEGTRTPATDVADLFDRPDETIQTNADWEALDPKDQDSGLKIVSEDVRVENAGGAVWNAGIFEGTALSTDDHYSSVVIDNMFAPSDSFNYVGVCVRHEELASRRSNHYFGAARRSAGENSFRYYWGKILTSDTTQTTFGTGAQGTAGTDESTVRCEMDGSDIQLIIGGTLRAGPITDTSLTANLNVGIILRARSGSDNQSQLDNFNGGDIAGLTPGPAGSHMSALYQTLKPNTLLRM